MDFGEWRHLSWKTRAQNASRFSACHRPRYWTPGLEADAQDNEMVLSANEESLINIVRAPPPVEARKVFDWARELAALGRERPAQWSDSWSEEDLADATAAPLARFGEQEREGH